MTTELDVKEKFKFQKPKKWVILLHNDDVTPMEFVIQLLASVFTVNYATATEVTLQIHNDGQGVAGIYSHEVAEQKIAEATHFITLANVPLKVTMEEE
tara:strand:+ start:731 stop:1024 length:294 start_codon:yes stop_codon:yes gene_type:complete